MIQALQSRQQATDAPFADQEYLDRHARAQALMEGAGLDARGVSEKNYCYFSGINQDFALANTILNSDGRPLIN